MLSRHLIGYKNQPNKTSPAGLAIKTHRIKPDRQILWVISVSLSTKRSNIYLQSHTGGFKRQIYPQDRAAKISMFTLATFHRYLGTENSMFFDLLVYVSVKITIIVMCLLI